MSDSGISRENTVGDVIERLSVSYPGSEIVVRNQLLELREDQRLAEVTDEGDTLTAFKQQRRRGAGSNMEEDDDLFVVILSSVTGELVFLRPGEASQLNLQKVAWNQIVSVFRSVKMIRKRFKIVSYRKEYNEEGRERREEGEIVLVGDKYDLAKVRELFIKYVLSYRDVH